MLIILPMLQGKISIKRASNFGGPTTYLRADGKIVLSSRLSGSFDAATAACKAARNIGGNSFPLLSARRRIPAHALGLK